MSRSDSLSLLFISSVPRQRKEEADGHDRPQLSLDLISVPVVRLDVFPLLPPVDHLNQYEEIDE